MKLNKLLATAAIVAFLPMTANAFTVVVGADTGTVVKDVELASEMAVASVGALNLEYDLALTGSLGARTDSTLAVKLPGGLAFSATVPTGALTVVPGGGAAAATGVTVIGGGGVDGDTVTFRFTSTDDNIDTDEIIQVVLPVKFTGCANIGAAPTFTYNDSLGGAIEAVTTIETVLKPCIPSVTITQAAVTAPNRLSLASGYKAFEANNTSVPTTGTGNTTVDVTFGTIAATLAAADKTLAGAPIANADITSIAFEVKLDDVTEVEKVQVADGDLMLKAASTDTWVYTNANPFATAEIDAEIDAAADIPAALAAKTASIQAGVITLNDATYGATAVDPTFAGGALATVGLEASDSKEFDWTSSSNSLSIFRITGLPAGVATTATLSLKEASAADGSDIADAEIPGTITADASGEAVLFSNDLKGAFPTLPDFRRANVTFQILAADVDVDRLVSSNGSVFEIEATVD